MLTAQQSLALLAAIDRHHTVIGARDDAILTLGLLSGLDIGAIRRLHWAPGAFNVPGPASEAGEWKCRVSRLIVASGGTVRLWVERRKGARQWDQELPPAAAQAIWSWLHAAGWSPTDPAQMGYLFPPVVKAQHALTGQDLDWNWRRPLSVDQTHNLLKIYARQAGLEPAAVTWHTLRHTAALLRVEAGDDAAAIRLFFGLSTVEQARRYIHRLKQYAARLPDAGLEAAGPLPRRPSGYQPGDLTAFKHGFYTLWIAAHLTPAERLESLHHRLALLTDKAARAATAAERRDWCAWIEIVSRKIARLEAASDPD